MRHLEITRPTVAANRRVKPGDIVEVVEAEARILIAAGKARPLDGGEPAGGPMMTRGNGALIEGAAADEPEAAGERSAPAFETMTKNQLEAYGRDELGVELDRRKSKADMIADIQSATEGTENAD
tara:strand:- start:374 stop:748 length:375 start_codon:yes stop_codon:yes gene_type:complete